MSLTTLTDLKTHLGVTSTKEDVMLGLMIRGCSAAIRKYTKKFLGGVVTKIEIGNPCIVTAPGHGLQNGDTLLFAGTDSTPVLDGLRVVTRLDADSFSVPVAVTVGGYLGYYGKQFTEFYSGDGSQFLKLKQTPVQSVASLYYDSTAYYGTAAGAFDPVQTLLTEGTDYVLVRDNANQTEVSIKGCVAGINRLWERPWGHPRGLLTPAPGAALGNIKITYVAGWMPIQDDIQAAIHQYVATLRRIRKTGAGVLSEKYDYYQYTLDPKADRDNALGGVRDFLSPYMKWVW